jgi:hypothetical protein
MAREHLHITAQELESALDEQLALYPSNSSDQDYFDTNPGKVDLDTLKQTDPQTWADLTAAYGLPPETAVSESPTQLGHEGLQD